MGRRPCCDKKGLKKGPWTPEEDKKLVDYIKQNGHGSWRSLPKLAGLLRCGKSCRLRWTNYLRPDIKRGPFTSEEEKLVIQLHGILGNRWAAIASQLSGRTDNEIKNLWNTHLKKRLLRMGIDPHTHEPSVTPTTPLKRLSTTPSTRHMAQWESARLEAEARLSRESSLLCPTSIEKSQSDFFMRIWNSEIGEAFRNFGEVVEEKPPAVAANCQSPATDQASSLTICGTNSATTSEMDLTGGIYVRGHLSDCSNQIEDAECKSSKTFNEDVLAGCDSCSSDDLEDSSESALQLLLDFPCNNDMSFLENHTDDHYNNNNNNNIGFTVFNESSYRCPKQEFEVGSF